MRDMKGGAKDAPSKGYAFVTFTEHQSALNALRKLNNNPEVSDIDRNFSNVPGRKRKRTRKRMFRSFRIKPVTNKPGFSTIMH